MDGKKAEPITQGWIMQFMMGRMLILIPIAACAYFLIASQDQTIRLAAFVALIILAQAREWMLLSKISGQLKDNKH